MVSLPSLAATTLAREVLRDLSRHTSEGAISAGRCRYPAAHPAGMGGRECEKGGQACERSSEMDGQRTACLGVRVPIRRQPTPTVASWQ